MNILYSLIFGNAPVSRILDARSSRQLETDTAKMHLMNFNEVLTPKAVIDAYRAEYEYVP